MISTYTQHAPVVTAKKTVRALHSQQHSAPLDDDLVFTLEDIAALNPDPGADMATFARIMHQGGAWRFTQDTVSGAIEWSRVDEPMRLPPATGKEQIRWRQDRGPQQDAPLRKAKVSPAWSYRRTHAPQEETDPKQRGVGCLACPEKRPISTQQAAR